MCRHIRQEEGSGSHDFSFGGEDTPAEICTTRPIAAKTTVPSHQFHAMAGSASGENLVCDRSPS